MKLLIHCIFEILEETETLILGKCSSDVLFPSEVQKYTTERLKNKMMANRYQVSWTGLCSPKIRGSPSP